MNHERLNKGVKEMSDKEFAFYVVLEGIWQVLKDIKLQNHK